MKEKKEEGRRVLEGSGKGVGKGEEKWGKGGVMEGNGMGEWWGNKMGSLEDWRE